MASPAVAFDPFAVLLPQPAPDETTAAVVRLLTTTDIEESAKAFDQLIGICYTACVSYRGRSGRRLYFWDQWPEYAAHFEEGTIGSKSGRENNEHTRLREWIQIWLVEELAPHRGKSVADIEDAAANGEFQYLGRRCQLAFRQAVARQIPKDKFYPRVCVQLNRSYATDDGDDDGQLIDAVTGPPINVKSNFDPRDLLWIFDEYRHEFDRLGVHDVMFEVLHGLALKKGETARNVAAKLGVGVRQARNRIKRCYETLKANCDRPAVQELYKALTFASVPNHARYELAVVEAKDSLFRRRQLAEAGAAMAQFKSWAGKAANTALAEEWAERSLLDANMANDDRCSSPSLLDDFQQVEREQESVDCIPEIDGRMAEEEAEIILT
jgi:hypothetical protein